MWKFSLWKRLQVESREHLLVRWKLLNNLWKLSQKDKNTKLVSVFISKKFSICVTICEIFHNESAFISDFFHKQFFLQNVWMTAHVRIYICEFFNNWKFLHLWIFSQSHMNIWTYIFLSMVEVYFMWIYEHMNRYSCKRLHKKFKLDNTFYEPTAYNIKRNKNTLKTLTKLEKSKKTEFWENDFQIIFLKNWKMYLTVICGGGGS